MSHFWEALFQLVNFALLAWLLIHFGKKPVLGMLNGRREEVTRLIEESETRRKEALSSLEEHRQSLARTEAEIGQITARAAEMGESLKKELVLAAQAEAERLRQNTRDAIALETRMAINDIRQEVINQAFEEAARDLQALPRDAQDQLVQDFVRKVGDQCAK